MNHFADPWVRIQAVQRSMSLIFFAQTFCIVFTLNWVSYDLGAVRKQCGPKRGRRRQFFLVYGITWFIVPGPAGRWCLVELFWADDGQTIPPHHSIAKYLKNLKLIPRTTTFFLRHCVNSLEPTYYIICCESLALSRIISQRLLASRKWGSFHWKKCH